MNIKTFIFLTSNYGYMASDSFNDRTKWRFIDIDSPNDIDNVINNFVINKNIIDIKINSIIVSNHNNGGSNKVQTTYTILYK